MMKKMRMILIVLAVITASGVCARAGAFNGYYDFQQKDGTYAYEFPRVLVTMDEMWYQKTRVVMSEGGKTASFYHKASYDAYAAEGLDGGRLFTLGASVNTDFKELPSFVYLGFDEEEAMNYYAALPTDYQAYTGDEEIREEYDELWRGVEDVLAGVVVKGSTKSKELTETEGFTEAVPSEKEPQPGEYLYQTLDNEKLANIKKDPPVELLFHVDQGGYGRTAVFKEGESLDRAVALFCDIKIAGEADEWVTDNYNWIGLIWADGTETYISLNLRNLEYMANSIPRTYRLENLNEFWSYAADYLEEDR